MKTVYKTGIVVFILSNIFCYSLLAKEEFVKNYSKEFSCSSNTTLEVVSKYGQINIENWEKQTVKIDVKVMVDHKSRVEAEKLLEMIHINFSQQGDWIKAITQIEEGFGTSSIWGRSISGKKFTIDYKIFLPKNINLKVSHKYGNMFISEIAGQVEIDLRYGNLNINKLTRGNDKPLNSIVLGYGNVSLQQGNWLKLNVSYSSDVDINTCKALIIISKYSKVRIGKSGSIVAESAYTNYNMGTVSNFVVTGKYGQFKIETLTNKLDAEIKYGGIDVDIIPASFQSIKMDNSYSNSKLGISSQASYKLDAYVKYAGINYPDRGKISRISENTAVTLHGYVGDENTQAEVSIKSSYGEVNLMKK
jgi:hypothetical protein